MFITSLPEGRHLNSTSIYTTPLKFSASSFPSSTPPAESENEEQPAGEGEGDEEEERVAADTPSKPWENDKRQWDLIEGISAGLQGAGAVAQEGEGGGDTVYVVPTYTAPVHYKVPKTGYYCVGQSAFARHAVLQS